MVIFGEVRRVGRFCNQVVAFIWPEAEVLGSLEVDHCYQCGRTDRVHRHPYEFEPQHQALKSKNISVQKGEQVLFDEIRYFFYITNRTDYAPEQIVSLANGRCNQENVIEQLKNGVNAMRMPVDELLSNWAYMVMTSLAWNLKAWFGLLLPNSQRGVELIKMEFRRFLHAIVLLPAQIVRTGRRVIYRIMSYNGWLKDLFAAWEHLRWLRAT
jgi:hypothetical protein